MEEKNVTKKSLSTLFLILSIVVIIIMGLFIYKLNSDKTVESNKVSELYNRIANLEDVNNNTATSSDLNTTISTSSTKAEIDNSKSEINHEAGKKYEAQENTVKEKTNTKSEDKDADKIHSSYTKDFVDENDEGEFIYSKNGKSYGWEEWLWEGCSTWCSVAEYESNATASSTLKPHGKYTYSVSNIQDLDKRTSWVEGVEGNGIGEYIEIEQKCLVGSSEYKTDIGFKELCIVNGYAATEKNWNENNRVKELKMYFNNKYVTTIVLEDIIKQQYIDISKFNLKVQNGEKARFKFEINDIYKGTKYNDTCITGLLIEFSGRTGH